MPKRRTRDEERVHKRQQRAKFYAQGLTHAGTPMKCPSKSPRLHNKHPDGCNCYDCLWGEEGRLV